MPSLADVRVLGRLLIRFDALEADDAPRWGAMSAQQMLCHLHDACCIALAELDAGSFQRGFFSSGLGRWLVIDSPLPWPKGRIVAPPAYHRSQPGDFGSDRGRLLAILARQARHPGPWGVSPLFGALSAAQWQRLQWRHCDHHLRQFGR